MPRVWCGNALESIRVQKGETMKIGVLGTGVVGQTLAASLAELGHELRIGTRNVPETLSRNQPGMYGAPPIHQWLEENSAIVLASFADTAAHGEVLINATRGDVSLDALHLAGEANLEGKVLLDASNPLDFSQGGPPSLWVSNTDSLGEQIQRAFPRVKVVKTLNTMTASLMVNPGLVAGGDHTVFLSGDDADAKAQTAQLLAEWFGWTQIVDLGDITTARGVEMYLPLWLRLWGALGVGMFNIKVVR